MKPSLHPPRTPSKLSDSLHRRLNSYALAASAAAVGALAMAGSAQAEVVYTPAHKPLHVNGFTYLDLNHDGVSDFRLYLASSRVNGFSFAYNLNVERASPSQSAKNEIYTIVSQHIACAAALPKGKAVGPKSPIHYSGLFMFANFRGTDIGTSYVCPWLHVVESAYLGVKFSIKGENHYGWIRVAHLSHQRPAGAEVTGYAYETIPNKPIITGAQDQQDQDDDQSAPAAFDVQTADPATLDMLALGAPGLSIWKREEAVAA